MAEELRKLTKAKTKTEAVRQALQAQLTHVRRALPVRERLARSKAMAATLGQSDPGFDMKAFTDDLWDDA